MLEATEIRLLRAIADQMLLDRIPSEEIENVCEKGDVNEYIKRNKRGIETHTSSERQKTER